MYFIVSCLSNMSNDIFSGKGGELWQRLVLSVRGHDTKNPNIIVRELIQLLNRNQLILFK
jgi:hypothetical protein